MHHTKESVKASIPEWLEARWSHMAFVLAHYLICSLLAFAKRS